MTTLESALGATGCLWLGVTIGWLAREGLAVVMSWAARRRARKLVVDPLPRRKNGSCECARCTRERHRDRP